MKISASKKTITILSISFVFLLFGLVTFWYRDAIRNGIESDTWFTLGKYNGLLELCEFKNKDKNIVINCQALLKEIKGEDNSDCYLSTILSKKQKSQTKNYTFCANDITINFDDEYIFEEKMIPVNLEIIFKDLIPGRAHLQLLNVRRMDDSDFYKIIEANEKIKIDSFEGRIKTKSGYPSIEDYQNYVIQEGNVYPGLSLEILNFLEAELIDLTKSDNSIIFTFKLRVKEKTIELKVKSANFVFVDPSLGGSESQEIINFTNTSKLHIGENYSIMLTSPTTDAQKFKQEFNIFCIKENVGSYSKEKEFICRNLDLISVAKGSIEGIGFIEKEANMEDKKQVVLQNSVLLFIIKI